MTGAGVNLASEKATVTFDPVQVTSEDLVVAVGKDRLQPVSGRSIRRW
ncbi:MAG: hypothetical protein M3256_14835 [Actinomycetota bacterium]|nr:hypothetical protein [Actinomycetota bacterium]